ncbi:MAG: hypothetical protein AAF959_04565 [Cyanobacteria bacterium P01_D01_bin.56]
MAAIQLFFLVLTVAYLFAQSVDSGYSGHSMRRSSYRPFRTTYRRRRRW